ncbi:ADP-ribosylglycohydrolase family protein [Propionibacterium freudenreichii]|uniref:ADP-ribosylglycohydrolase family protein n=1 Tax=Propionibacterium freudenreichii TaxID=1744 RepID=UPI00254B7C90|nr:ADP-ribosylglycohydrolase family protein [Propionibacterium freudenreichii]
MEAQRSVGHRQSDRNRPRDGVPHDGVGLGEAMTAIARDVGRQGQAGNGGLMRTSVVGLAAVDSAEETANAAARVCALTHGEPRCIESSVLWSLAVRNAVLTGNLDVRSGLPQLAPERRSWWQRQIASAEDGPPSASPRTATQ